jgi:hypothetical protein
MRKHPPHSNHIAIVCYELCSDGKVFGSISCPPGSRGAVLAELLGQLLVMKKRGYLRQTVVLETVAEQEVARLSLDRLKRRGSLQRADGKRFDFRILGKLDWRSPRGGFVGMATHLPDREELEGEVRQNQPDCPISPYHISLWGLLQLANIPSNPTGVGSSRFSSISSRFRDVSSSSAWVRAEPLLP